MVLGGLTGSDWAFVGLWALPLLVSKGIPATRAVWYIFWTMTFYAIGAPVLGWVADRSRRSGMTLTVACVGAFACWMLLACDAAFRPETLGLLLFPLGFFSGGFHVVYAVVTERNPIEHAGTATVYVNIGTFLGAALIQSTAAILTAGGDYAACVVPMTSTALIAVAASLALWLTHAPSVAAAADAGLPGSRR